jgi:hypothetical protein
VIRMDKPESLRLAELKIAFLERRVAELEKELESSETDVGRWMKKALSYQFAIVDHKNAVAGMKEPTMMKQINIRLWETALC